MDLRLAALWMLVAAAGAGVGWWSLVGVRVLRDMPRIPRARHGLAMPVPVPAPRVSVVIPAHDEENHAPRAVRSILASRWSSLEVIVVLDRCTDGTLAALRPIADADPRLRLIENHACPADWAGKCNAARVGAEVATGDLLLFTDADVEFHPDLLRATVAILKARGLGLLSLLASPRVRHWFEAVVQPVAAIMLMRMYPIPRVNDPDRPRAFANGQFMLFDRGVYEAIGGHASVKDDLLEDIAFAHRVRAHGSRGGLCTAEDLLSVEMYERMSEFRTGWKRIYIEAAERDVPRLRALGLECLVVGALLPMAGLVAVAAGSAWGGGPLEPLASVVLWLGVASVTIFVAVVTWLHAMCRAPALAAVFHPLGAWLVAHCFLESAADLAARRPVRWGGREYVLTPMPGGRYGHRSRPRR